MRSLRFILTISTIFCLVSTSALAALLSDSELFFDPDSFAPDFYARIELTDLTATNFVQFVSGGDPVVDADILPVLVEGSYPSGYTFSQSDYDAQPNVDYTADLTTGTLTTVFQVPGLYHVRVTRSGAGEEIFAIFAETVLQEKDGAADKTGTHKKVPIPDADLWIIDNGDADNATAVDTILTAAGETTEKVDTRAAAFAKIKARSEALGRKIHVEFAGHGTNGNASTGAGDQNVADKQIDATSVAAFQTQIDDFVDNITFFGMCKVGKGDDGKAFLQVLADSIGKSTTTG